MTLTTLIRRSQGATAALVLLSVLQFTLSEPASSQVVEEIRANPELWTLRSIWKVTGTYSGEGVGAGIGSVGDLNKDGLGDFAYYTIDPPVVGGIWRVHYGSEGGPSKDTAWVFGQGAGGVSHPVVGKFRGDDSHDVGFLSYRWVDSGKTTDFYFQLRFFAVENDSLRSVPSYTWDPGLTMDSNWFTFPNDFLAMDMDQSEGDELVMVSSVSLRNRVRSQVGEIWLYKGGADFQVDQPTHVIVDQEENFLENQYYLYTEDFDGDSYIDMVLGTQYRDGNYKLKFWFGREGSPWNWTNEPDRVLLLGSTGLNHELSMGDYDGDGTVDLAGTVYDGDLRYIHIYLSSSGKDFRTRSFARSDAEKVLQTTLLRPFGRVGALNDSSGRYEMLSMIGPSIYHANEPMLVLFGGGKSGPNNTWDAYYSPSADGVTAGGVVRHVEQAGDVNGDGWPDLLLSDDRWYLFDHGIAMVIAGGPEIPTDDTTLSVRAIATAEHRRALHIWPNPMRDKLQIVWRGDLRRLPRRFTIHNALGELVAEGEVEPGVGAARWESQDSPSGLYLLTVYDRQGEVLATTEVVKTE